DGGQLSQEEKALRDFYKKLLNFTLENPALLGGFLEIHAFNRANNQEYDSSLFSFLRWGHNERLLILVNFSADNGFEFELKVPVEGLEACNLEDASYLLTDQLNQAYTTQLFIHKNEGRALIQIAPLGC